MTRTDTPFHSVDAFEPADLANCGEGLFQSGAGDHNANVLVLTEGEQRFGIYLNHEKVFYIRYNAANAGRGVGILWPTPTVEVDPATLYRPNRTGESPGDLLIGGGRLHVVATLSGGFDDVHPLPLWAVKETAIDEPIGFRSWRLLSVIGDQRRVIYERAEAQS